jgi:hypothetical protein
MKNPIEIIKENEEHIEDFISWQVETEPCYDLSNIARSTTKAAEIFKSAAILYPEFILVEDQVVLASNYSEENWKAWREKHDARHSANLVNHTHVEDLLPNEAPVVPLERGLGELLSFFWLLAAKYQFPDKTLTASFDGCVINLLNE